MLGNHMPSCSQPRNCGPAEIEPNTEILDSSHHRFPPCGPVGHLTRGTEQHEGEGTADRTEYGGTAGLAQATRLWDEAIHRKEDEQPSHQNHQCAIKHEEQTGSQNRKGRISLKPLNDARHAHGE